MPKLGGCKEHRKTFRPMNQKALYLKEGLWAIPAVANSWSGCQ